MMLVSPSALRSPAHTQSSAQEGELQAARKVLTAAALTYVAAALASVMTLVRLLLLGRRS